MRSGKFVLAGPLVASLLCLVLCTDSQACNRRRRCYQPQAPCQAGLIKTEVTACAMMCAQGYCYCPTDDGGMWYQNNTACNCSCVCSAVILSGGTVPQCWAPPKVHPIGKKLL